MKQKRKGDRGVLSYARSLTIELADQLQAARDEKVNLAAEPARKRVERVALKAAKDAAAETAKLAGEVVQPAKRARGRPRKQAAACPAAAPDTAGTATSAGEIVQPAKRTHGRPRKQTAPMTIIVSDEEGNLTDLDDEKDDEEDDEDDYLDPEIYGSFL